MFSGTRHGRAREAVEFYVSLFPGASLVSMDFFESSDTEPAGTVRRAVFRLDGRQFMAMDSVVPHRFNFTPSVSFLIQCESEDEIASLFGALADGGETLMPLDDYGFSHRFGWVNDRFGVSWQLNLPG
jgi:predicted 3-demethylubiquinone-9 3-methyltransferase (glyoxalase superfamily)